jgi:uncharacterized cupin superfamily protein
MYKINTLTMAEEEGLIGAKYGAIGKDVSIALGRDGDSTDLLKRHPFDVEISRIPPGRINTLFHAHGAQWEFYHVIEGRGKVRDDVGITPIEKGDAFLFKPGEAHQIINDNDYDLIVYVVADNPISDLAYLPDENRWIAKSPQMKKLRFDSDRTYPDEEN